MVENIPADEAAQIANIIDLTRRQLSARYTSPAIVRRGVHPKDHGCVDAVFRVNPDLEDEFKIALFAESGREFRSLVRFSNAATLIKPDSVVNPTTGKPVHGSRGMAIKLFDVPSGESTIEQDFLMVNHPVFAFANVEDYEILSRVILETFDPATHSEDPGPFFATQIAKGGDAEIRAKVTLGIVARITAASKSEGGFQDPPANPAQNEYFSAAPFSFGPDHVMKYRVTPVNEPVESPPDIADTNYLREGLRERLDPRVPENRSVNFRFSAQIRRNDSLNIDVDIENATTHWKESDFPFTELATVSIAPQELDSDAARDRCEKSFFSPWHTLEMIRPLGGINRLRRGVYEASFSKRTS